MKPLKTLLLALVILAVGISCFYSFWLSPRYTVPILTYHYFCSDSSVLRNNSSLLFVSQGNFEKQMRYIKVHGYQVIPLDTLVDGLKSGKSFPHNTLVITIDDGVKSIYTYAYPVLRKYGFPATVFLISDFIGTRQGFLDWDEVKEMSKHNISFGGHTRHHVPLAYIEKKDILWDEISGCKQIIESHLGLRIDYFAYPFGSFTEEVTTLIKDAGYKAACATNRGRDRLNRTYPYELNRISIRDADPDFSFANLSNSIRFWSKLSGYYNIFRKTKVTESNERIYLQFLPVDQGGK